MAVAPSVILCLGIWTQALTSQLFLLLQVVHGPESESKQTINNVCVQINLEQTSH